MDELIDLNTDWHYARIVHSEMVHFLRQLQAFYQLEVVECSWSVLAEFIEKRTGDLDALIHAHRVFLERLVRKVLLSGGKRDKEVSTIVNKLTPGNTPHPRPRSARLYPALSNSHREFSH